VPQVFGILRTVPARRRSVRCRRQESDILRDGIYELRVGLRGTNYRMLYFFHGKNAVVVSHGLTKERSVPSAQIELALSRKGAFEAAPSQHTARG
jgi:phage-related protein